jgi:hypothetical protein
MRAFATTRVGDTWSHCVGVQKNVPMKFLALETAVASGTRSCGETHRDWAGRAGTKSLGQSCDSIAASPRTGADSGNGTSRVTRTSGPKA